MRSIAFKHSFILFIVFGFFACQKSKKTDVSLGDAIENSDSIRYSDIANKNIDIEEEEEEEVVGIQFFPNEFAKNDTVKRAEFRIYNHTNSNIKFGSPFRVEKLIDNEWRSLPLNEHLGFEDILYFLEPGTYLEIPFFISTVFNDKYIESGNYRMVKEVWKSGKDLEKISLTAEFTVDM